MRRSWLHYPALHVVLPVALALALALAGCGGSSVDPYDDGYYDEGGDGETTGDPDSGEAAGDGATAESADGEAAGEDGAGEAAGEDGAGEAADAAAGGEGDGAADGEPTAAERDATALYQAAWMKYLEAKVAWEKYRDETKAFADWQEAKTLIEGALDNLDEIGEKAPDFKRKEDLAETCSTFRMMLLGQKPEEGAGGGDSGDGGDDGGDSGDGGGDGGDSGDGDGGGDGGDDAAREGK